MNNEERFDETYYGDHNYALLVFETDGRSMTLKLKVKKAPGMDESGTIWAKNTGRKWTLNFGLGDEEFDENELPNPIKKLIAGGAKANAVPLPPKDMILTPQFLIIPYADYMKRFNSNKIFGLRIYDKPLPEKFYYQVAVFYLQILRSKYL